MCWDRSGITIFHPIQTVVQIIRNKSNREDGHPSLERQFLERRRNGYCPCFYANPKPTILAMAVGFSRHEGAIKRDERSENIAPSDTAQRKARFPVGGNRVFLFLLPVPEPLKCLPEFSG